MHVKASHEPLPIAVQPKPRVEVHPGPHMTFTYVARDASGEEAWRYPNKPKEDVIPEDKQGKGKPGQVLDLKV